MSQDPRELSTYERLHEAALLERALTQSKTGPSQAAFVAAAKQRLREQGIEDADVFISLDEALEAE